MFQKKFAVSITMDFIYLFVQIIQKEGKQKQNMNSFT